jgi:hypothetical protein
MSLLKYSANIVVIIAVDPGLVTVTFVQENANAGISPIA